MGVQSEGDLPPMKRNGVDSEDTRDGWLGKKEDNTMQMVRVLQGRLKALVAFAVLEHKVTSISKRTLVENPSNDTTEGIARDEPTQNDTEKEEKAHDEDEEEEEEEDEEEEEEEESDDDFDDEFLDDDENYPIDSLAYRNPRTPHTEAEKRMESLFQEYHDEMKLMKENNQSFRIMRSKSFNRKLSGLDSVLERDEHRKKLQLLKTQLENNSTRYLARSSNSLIFRLQDGEERNEVWPIPISETEMNPALLLELSLQMIEQPRTRHDIESATLHKISQDLFVHAFWLTHVQFFQKLSGREQRHLQGKISTLYPKIITVLNQTERPLIRDLFFRTYPLVLAQAIYLGCVYLCPGNTGLFQGRFLRVLSHSMFCLLTGIDISASSVDYLRQKLYQDQQTEAFNSVEDDLTNNSERNNNMNRSNEQRCASSLPTDLPRQQQRVAFDAYKVSPLLDKYLGGDVCTQGRLMLLRTVPSENCQAGGVNTFQSIVPTLNLSDEQTWDRRNEARSSAIKDGLREKIRVRREIQALQREQQNLMRSNKKTLRKVANHVLEHQERRRKLMAVSRS